jgi:predicted RNase H-like nuclease (RuvC/YqgF family)
VRHLGPTAQDFHAAFGLGGADNTHIATVDADGVALAAAQALDARTQRQQQTITAQQRTIDAQGREIAALRRDNAALHTETAELRARLEAIERALRAQAPRP